MIGWGCPVARQVWRYDRRVLGALALAAALIAALALSGCKTSENASDG